MATKSNWHKSIYRPNTNANIKPQSSLQTTCWKEPKHWANKTIASVLGVGGLREIPSLGKTNQTLKWY